MQHSPTLAKTWSAADERAAAHSVAAERAVAQLAAAESRKQLAAERADTPQTAAERAAAHSVAVERADAQLAGAERATQQAEMAVDFWRVEVCSRHTRQCIHRECKQCGKADR